MPGVPVVAHRVGKTWNAWFHGQRFTAPSAGGLRRVLIGAGADPAWVKAALDKAGAGAKAPASSRSTSKKPAGKAGKKGK